MARKKENNAYEWKYCSLGGVTRVNISSGEDIAHLGELDQKLWTVLSCPVKGLHIDEKTLGYMDTDGDGKIRVNEVVAASRWLCSVVRDRDSILKGSDSLAIEGINADDEAGKKLLDSAKRILTNIGKESGTEITLADTEDMVAIFAKTKFNGDGIITEASADDEALKALIRTIIEKEGAVTDRSGEAGTNAELIEQFFTACAEYSAWQEAGKADASIFPYGENTAAALAACEAVRSKIVDFFIRCKLVKFNDACTGAVDVSAEKLGNISDMNLTECGDQIAQYPIAHPTAEAVLPFDGINPAWQAAFAQVKSLVFDVDFPEAKGITEDQWDAVIAKFGAYSAWNGAAKGVEVADLGLEAVQAVVREDRKQALLDLVGSDLAVKEESDSILEVNKLMHIYRDFAQLLRNYVSMTDFYSPDLAVKGIFEEGSLYIDQRCCRLCIKVTNMGGHADMAALSGMFLIYCTCTSKTKGETMDIVAVMTDGSIKNLRPGTNAIFYDRDGLDWDAVVTKVIDNPLSVKQAFFSPYRKFADTITERINKNAAEKENKVSASMISFANAVGTDGKPAIPAAPQGFDIAKFAGIFAAIGMAVAYLTTALAKLVTPWTNVLIVLALLIVCISGPSMFLAWQKLRKRNLGPVLNANGWAINSSLLINILFGRTLTSVAKYPRLNLEDPYAGKTPCWKKCLYGLVILAGVGAALYFTNCLSRFGLPSPKAKKAAIEQLEQPSAEESAPVAETVSAETPAAE